MSKNFAETYEDLDVYQKAFVCSLEIHKVSQDFPKSEQYALADQARRASKSVCANLAEGFIKQRGSKAEFKRFILMALGSAGEMLVWIEYCRELSYVDKELAKKWKEDYTTICKMLQALHSSIKP